MSTRFLQRLCCPNPNSQEWYERSLETLRKNEPRWFGPILLGEVSYARQILVEQRLHESQKGLCPGERERCVAATSHGATGSESSCSAGGATSASSSEVVINAGKLEQQVNALASAQASAQRSKRLPPPARLPPPSARTTKGHADGKKPRQQQQQQQVPPRPTPKAATSDEAATGWGPFAWLKARVFIYTGLATASPAAAADVWPEYDVEAGEEHLTLRQRFERAEDAMEEDAGSTSGVAMDATAGASSEEDGGVDDEGEEDGTARVRSADRVRIEVRSSAVRVNDEGVPAKEEEAEEDEDAGAPLPPRAAATGHTGDEPGSSSGGEDIEDETQVKTKVKGANGAEEEEEEPFDINQLHWFLRLFAPPPDHMQRMLAMRESQYRAYGSYGISSSFHSSHLGCYGSAF